jgi:hypothetical protein
MSEIEPPKSVRSKSVNGLLFLPTSLPWVLPMSVPNLSGLARSPSFVFENAGSLTRLRGGTISSRVRNVNRYGCTFKLLYLSP